MTTSNRRRVLLLALVAGASVIALGSLAIACYCWDFGAGLCAGHTPYYCGGFGYYNPACDGKETKIVQQVTDNCIPVVNGYMDCLPDPPNTVPCYKTWNCMWDPDKEECSLNPATFKQWVTDANKLVGGKCPA